MSAIEKIRKWVKTYPGMGKVMDLFVDYYSMQLDGSSIAPSGLTEISRREDVLGNLTVENQYNFKLSFVFPKAPGDDDGATENADWLLDFQQWVQEQSIRQLVPVFGDDPRKETAKAQNGTNEYATIEGSGLYTVLLSVNFFKIYEVK